MRAPGRVGWAWIEAALLSVVLGAVGFWIGGGLGAGLGVAAGGLTPLLIEQAARKQDAAESAAGARALPRAYGPAHLLEPGLAVVPFTGRRTELKLLDQWCGAAGCCVRLVTGGGGSGKTRLALELCERMTRSGWRCSFVAEGIEGDAVVRERAAAPRSRLLLVADYAEARKGLEELLAAAARDEGHVRVLLLARHAGDWWQRLGAGAGAVRDVVTRAALEHVTLAGDLDPGLPAEDLVRQAVPYFAARLGVPAPAAEQVTVIARGDLQVLDLHAAALVAVLESADQPEGAALQVDAAMVLEELLGHEKHYWRGRAEAAGLLGGQDGLSMAQLCQVAAAACLLGASTAGALAGRVPGMTVTEAVALWARELYPPDEDGMLGVLRPDRLAELLVTRELAAAPELAEACLTGLNAGQARRALVLLASASADRLEARTLLEASLSRFPEVVAHLAEPREVMTAVANAIPYPSLALASAHASVARRILMTYGPGEPGRALWLNTLGVLLGDLGQSEEALAAIEEAVAIRRDLAKARSNVFLADLATSLNNLAVRLSELGRRQDALAVIEEAVAVRRMLVEARSDAFLPDLATSLSNHSSCLAQLWRRADALAVIEEAVAIRRTLAETRPRAFLPDLAASLVNLSNQLSGQDRLAEALAMIEEAIAAYRALAAAAPDAFLRNLATSVNNRSVYLLQLRRREEALAAAEEAVAIRRALAETQPDAFLPDLATSLTNQSSCLWDLRRRADALTVLEEAITARRVLAEGRPDTFLPDLAAGLSSKSQRLSELGRREDALAALEEAITIRRVLATARPDAFLPDLAASMTSQSVFLTDLGRPEEALTVIEETVTAYGTLADNWLTVFDSSYANSLDIQARILSSQGRHDEAHEVCQRSAAVRRRMVRR